MLFLDFKDGSGFSSLQVIICHIVCSGIQTQTVCHVIFASLLKRNILSESDTPQTFPIPER